MNVVGVKSHKTVYTAMVYSREYAKKAKEAGLPELWMSVSFKGTTQKDKRVAFSTESEEEMKSKLPELKAQAKKDKMVLMVFESTG